jgi:hypothetical protein
VAVSDYPVVAEAYVAKHGKLRRTTQLDGRHLAFPPPSILRSRRSIVSSSIRFPHHLHLEL